jgi:hypothetical protein
MKSTNQRASGFRVFEKFMNQRISSLGFFLISFGIEKPQVSSFKTLKRTCGFQGITGKV